TMGFSPLEGVPMATRPGAIDPEILLYLLRHGYLTADVLEHELEHESGLLGLGGSARVEALESSTEPEARLALDVFVHQVAGAVPRIASPLRCLDAKPVHGIIGNTYTGVMHAQDHRSDRR